MLVAPGRRSSGGVGEVIERNSEGPARCGPDLRPHPWGRLPARCWTACDILECAVLDSTHNVWLVVAGVV